MEVLSKNTYVGRSFIQPSIQLRQLSVTKKFGPLFENFRNKRVVLIDDSIVRGTTMQQIVKLLKVSGATEVSLLSYRIRDRIYALAFSGTHQGSVASHPSSVLYGHQYTDERRTHCQSAQPGRATQIFRRRFRQVPERKRSRFSCRTKIEGERTLRRVPYGRVSC